ncbi:integrase [Nitrosomonas nitrosa]|nr:integrase [Nitrosomonas nitrosa]
MGKLKALQIKSLPAGNHLDGHGLYLRVSPTGGRSWVFRYKDKGRARELGLGSLFVRGLAEARIIAADMRRAVYDGLDPKTVLAPKKQSKTFQAYAEELIESKKAGWRNQKHAQQWTNTLQQYAFPVLGEKQIHEIDHLHVIEVLRPLWNTKTETASRLRSRIESVIDFGYLHENIDKGNPARWRGCMDKVFAKPSKVREVVHFAAIHYADLPAVMAKLREKSAMSALCCRWIALTACRSSEAREAVWDEIDLKKNIWIIPGARMKMGKEHRVPLTSECIEILQDAKNLKPNSSFVFVNERGAALSDVSLSKMLKSVSNREATVHGLRSSFIDWASEQTSYPREVVEQALAHSIGAVEAAYRRSDLFEKRRGLMNEWASYLAKKF